MPKTFVLGEGASIPYVMSDPVRTPSEAAIVWFLKALWAEEKRGADENEILLAVGIGRSTFFRAWARLNKEGIIERRYIYKPILTSGKVI